MATPDAANNLSDTSCSPNQSLLLTKYSWVFTPQQLQPLICIGGEQYCSTIQERNRSFAETLLSLSAVFCCFNVLNIVSNSICYALFRKQDSGGVLLQSLVVLLLKALSLLEILFHLFFLLYHITEQCMFYSMLEFRGLPLSIISCSLINVMIVLQTCFHIARNWVVVAISSFRYEAVCRAMQPTKVFTSVSRVHAMLAGIVACSFVISLPRFFFFSCLACERSAGRYSLDSLEPRFVNQLLHAFNSAYLITGLLIFQTGGPILAVCLFSVCIIFSLRRHRRLTQSLKRPSEASRERPGLRGNLLVIILCSTFLVLEFPLFISKILYGRIDDKRLDAVIVGISKFATLLDSFLNIFIYSISNRKFREDLRQVFGFGSPCQRRQAAQRRPSETLALQSLDPPPNISRGLPANRDSSIEHDRA